MKSFVLLLTFCFIAYAQATSNLRHPTSDGKKRSLLETYTQLTSNLIHLTGKKRQLKSENQKVEEVKARLRAIRVLLGHFYCDTADSEGRGRLPGQSKFNVPVGPNYVNTDTSTSGTAAAQLNSDSHQSNVLEDLGLGSGDGWQQYDDTSYPINTWVRLCSDDDLPDHFKDSDENVLDNAFPRAIDLNSGADSTVLSFIMSLAGGVYQDGCIVYTVVAGGGSGSDVYSPIAYLANIESAVDFQDVWQPTPDYCHKGYLDDPNWIEGTNNHAR